MEGVARGPRLRTSVRPGLTEAHVTQLIMPQHCNTLGITFGGQVMSWIEQCAYISASRLRAPHVLTAALDSVVFSRATRLGHMLYVVAQVTAIWGSSLEVQVSVHGEDPEEGELFHCVDAFITLVCVAGGPGGSPTALTPLQIPFRLEPSCPAERLRYEGAVLRRQQRLEIRTAFQEADQHAAPFDP
ncbi:HotDog domain-containing protein [Haematococcus lacustris]